MLHGPIQAFHEVELRTNREMPDHGACDDETVGVDGVGGIGRQDDIARRGHGHGQMRQSFLGTQRDDCLGLGIDGNVEAALVIG